MHSLSVRVYKHLSGIEAFQHRYTVYCSYHGLKFASMGTEICSELNTRFSLLAVQQTSDRGPGNEATFHLCHLVVSVFTVCVPQHPSLCKETHLVVISLPSGKNHVLWKLWVLYLNPQMTTKLVEMKLSWLSNPLYSCLLTTQTPGI